jgi:hypothetical protein
VEPLACGVPGAKALIWERSRDVLKTQAWADRWFVSCREPAAHPPSEYCRSIREHWGVENRLHWPKDAILREDDSKARHPKLMANVMLLRNMVIFLHKTGPHPDLPLPAWIENNQASAMSLIRTLNHRSLSK